MAFLCVIKHFVCNSAAGIFDALCALAPLRGIKVFTHPANAGHPHRTRALRECPRKSHAKPPSPQRRQSPPTPPLLIDCQWKSFFTRYEESYYKMATLLSFVLGERFRNLCLDTNPGCFVFSRSLSLFPFPLTRYIRLSREVSGDKLVPDSRQRSFL